MNHLSLGSIAVAAALAVLAAPSARAGEEDASGSPLAVTLENLDGKARMQISGEASYLPDGTLLHVSLTIADRHPPVEAGFFRVSVTGGKYGGYHEWERKSFAPMAYRTEVRLIMEVQNPSVKRFLSRELGYTAQHVEVIAATRTIIGSEEERSAFQIQTLRTLREFQERLTALHGELVTGVAFAPSSPEFAAFCEKFIPRLRDVRNDLKTLEATRVVWYDAGLFSALGQVVFQLTWAIEQHSNGAPVEDLQSIAADLRNMKDGIDSRLPVEPESPGSSEPGGSE